MRIKRDHPPPQAAGSAGKEDSNESDTDLTTLLTAEQLERLVKLLDDITRKMRLDLKKVFDAPATAPGGESGVKKEEDAKKNPIKTARKPVPPSLSPRLRDLRNAVGRNFDTWRLSVLKRVNDVLGPDKAKASGQRKARPGTPGSETEAEDEERGEVEDPFLVKYFPPLESPLRQLPRKVRQTIIQSLLLLLLSLERYDSRSRTFLLYLTSTLALPLSVLVDHESSTASFLTKSAKKLSAEEEAKKRSQGSSFSRGWKIGAATVGGAVLIGLTGGLAAPILAAGVGTIMGGLGLGATAAASLLGAVAGSSTIIGALFGAYGGRMTGEMVDRYSAEVEDFKFIPLREGDENKMRVGIAITGWLVNDESEITAPYKFLGGGLEAYALRWETKALLDLGYSLNTIMTDAAFVYLKMELLKRTVFAALYAAVWPVGLLKAARVIDNPFSIAKLRSEKAGLVLADAIINKAQGERPLTLISHSLGARVIYSCLLSLAERKAFGLIENVVLLGAPIPAEREEWQIMRTVVVGRLVNVFSTNDYILGFLYRTSSVQFGIAGLQAIENVSGVENIDVSERVKGHLKYAHAVGPLLRGILEGDMDIVEVEAEEEVLGEIEMHERELEEVQEVKLKDEEVPKEMEQKIEEVEGELLARKLKAMDATEYETR